MQSSSILSLDLEMFVDLVKVDNNPTKIPYNFKDVSRFASQFLEQRNDVCQSITGTSCKAIDEHLIIHNEKDESPSEILMICRNLEYGSYLVVSIRPSTNKNECLASYLYLFSQTKERGELEVIWHKLTQKASSDDWVTLDEIIEGTMSDPSKKMILIDRTFDTNKVFDKETRSSLIFFLEQAEYFIDVDEEEQLPALLLVDCETARGLCAILNHPDGFAKKVIVGDEHEEVLIDFESLEEGYTALYYPMTLRHGYRSLEDTIEEVLMYAEDREINYEILDQLNEHDRATIERLILEREDILLEEEYINELRTLSPQEIKIITDRSKS
jgi:hypothetical protein